jgi:phospholipase C
MTTKLKTDAPGKTMALLLALTTALGPTVVPALAASKSAPKSAVPATATPIEHLVVIFQENVSFDHYFATYPVATNPSGEPKFKAAAKTPTVNGLTGTLLSNNPNRNPANGGPRIRSGLTDRQALLRIRITITVRRDEPA